MDQRVVLFREENMNAPYVRTILVEDRSPGGATLSDGRVFFLRMHDDFVTNDSVSNGTPKPMSKLVPIGSPSPKLLAYRAALQGAFGGFPLEPKLRLHSKATLSLSQVVFVGTHGLK